MLHYNFPPYSVGEVKRIGGPSRRDIGHGGLSTRAIEKVLPAELVSRGIRDADVSTLLLEDVRKWDAGSHFSRRFRREHVPTFGDVADNCAEVVNPGDIDPTNNTSCISTPVLSKRRSAPWANRWPR